MNNKILSNIFKGDKVIWMVFFFLAIISIVEVYSASSQLTYKGGNYMAPIIKHTGILLMGLIAMLFTLQVKPKYFKLFTPFLLIFSLVTLIMLLFVGQSTNGAVRWINLFYIQFQPSEIAKGALVLATAQILSAMQTDKGADQNAFKYILLVSGIIVFPIMLENLSTAMLICSVIFMMMIIGRVPMAQLGKLMGVVMLAVFFVFATVMLLGKDETTRAEEAATEQVVEGDMEHSGMIVAENSAESAAPKHRSGIFHRFDTWKSRIVKFMDNKEVTPQDIDLDKDAQVAHANIAIASSNVVGRGPGNSVERDFLSQAFSDFIYAIIIEELGIFGAAFVALLYIILLFRAARIANNCENSFPAYLCMGLALLLVTQALFNMCVAVGLVPVTGQPLPLVSKGGTSSVINCVYLGMILSISRYAKKKNNVKGAESQLQYATE